MQYLDTERSSKMGKNLQQIHNDGQADGANGEYDAPHDTIDQAVGFFFYTQRDFERMMEENDAYDQGHSNGKK